MMAPAGAANPGSQIMIACPSCQHRTIGFWAKVNSTPAFPVACTACGRAFHLSSMANALLILAPVPLLMGAVLASFQLGSWWGLVLAPIAFLALAACLGIFGALASIDPEEARSNRRFLWMLGLFFSALLLSGFIFR